MTDLMGTLDRLTAPPFTSLTVKIYQGDDVALVDVTPLSAIPGERQFSRLIYPYMDKNRRPKVKI